MQYWRFVYLPALLLPAYSLNSAEAQAGVVIDELMPKFERWGVHVTWVATDTDSTAKAAAQTVVRRMGGCALHGRPARPPGDPRACAPPPPRSPPLAGVG